MNKYIKITWNIDDDRPKACCISLPVKFMHFTNELRIMKNPRLKYFLRLEGERLRISQCLQILFPASQKLKI
jgi:hypothetical protein